MYDFEKFQDFKDDPAYINMQDDNNSHHGSDVDE